MNRLLLLLTLLFGTTIVQAATLTPFDVSRFAVTPNTDSTFQWRMAEPLSADKLAFTVFDVYGNATSIKETASADGETVSASVTLPQGYWEIAFDSLDERFGIVSLPVSESWDKFFAIDGALSWLVRGDDLREGMIKLCKRSGIGMVRERLRFSGVAYEDGKFDWNTGDHYDTVRETYKKHGIEVLELFHDTPPWMGRIKVYPKNLIAFADAADKMTEQWEHTWGGIELWNEPDIFFGGDLPADQYLPLVKAYTYRANKRGGKTPIVGGCLAVANLEWLDNAKKNNLLDLIDVFSFHTYDRAPNMENIVETYRNYVADGEGHENMPLWLTECGRPWKKGPGRPPVEQDLESVTDIVMKGVESKCCGIDRYFPFVLPYYEENDNNFGMLDRQGTPLRSFAGYAQMICALAHKEYVGDLKSEALNIKDAENSPKILRARVFRNSKGGPYVVVLYTGSMEPTKFRTNFSVRKAEAVTGEPCEGTEIRSGLIYLYADAIADDMIQKDTNAMRLLSYTKKPFVPKTRETHLSPVVPVFLYDENVMKPNSKGYRLDPNLKESRFSFQMFNLSNMSQRGHLGLYDTTNTAECSLEPNQSKVIAVPDTMLSVGETHVFHYDYRDEAGRCSCVDIRFFGSPTMKGQREAHPDAVRIPLDKQLWTPGIPGNGQLTIESAGDGVKMNATFGEGDKWCYPKIALPENLKLKKDGGIFAKIRYSGEGTVPRIFLFEQLTGAGFLSDDAFLTPYKGHKDGEGEWYVITIPFSAFAHNASTPPPADGKLDFDRIKEISFGFNTGAQAATLEVGEVWIYE